MNDIRKTVKLTVATVDAVGAYLMARPWQEVNGLILQINREANDLELQLQHIPPDTVVVPAPPQGD